MFSGIFVGKHFLTVSFSQWIENFNFIENAPFYFPNLFVNLERIQQTVVLLDHIET